MSNRKYFFVHIPRSGGTNLVRTLRSNTNLNIIHYDGFRKSGALKYDLIFGHIPLVAYPDREIITWMRDPVDRVLSNFFYLKQKPVQPGGLSQGVADYPISGNSAVRFFKKSIQLPDFARLTANLASKYITDRNLVSFVGIFEEFEKSVSQLSKFLGTQIPYVARKVRPAKRPAKVDPKIEGYIREVNSKDYELYNYFKRVRIGWGK